MQLLKFLFNRFDFAIRFMYTQLGPLSRFFHKVMASRLYRSNSEVLDRDFERFHEIYLANHQSLEGKTVVELGPGNSLISAFNFLMKGSRKVILVDKFPRMDAEQVSEEELLLMEKKYGRKPHFVDESLHLKPGYIDFYVGDILDMPFQDIDLLYSISVLEHVKRVDEIIEATARVLQRGACQYHKIDLRDHYNFDEPFMFYKYSEHTWENLLTKEGLSYTNRVRANEFAQLFADNALEIIHEDQITYSKLPKRINKFFAERNDLLVGELEVLVQKK